MKTLASRIYFAVPLVLMLLLSGIFVNVFMVDNELYDPTRTGKIFFMLQYIPYLVVVGIPAMLYQIRKQPDPVTLSVLVFYGWMWIVGRTGGIWNDEKFLYWTAGAVLFLVYRSCITLHKGNNEKYSFLWIPVLAVTLTGGIEAVIGQLQVFDRYTIYHRLYKVTGTFFNPAPYAGFLVACLPYALTMANPPEKTKLTRILPWLGLLVSW